jgi:predicted RNase H-like nuclease (RuvC/YqgF family)
MATPPRQMTADERDRLKQALDAHQRGDLAAALTHYTTLLDAFPNQPAILANRA